MRISPFRDSFAPNGNGKHPNFLSSTVLFLCCAATAVAGGTLSTLGPSPGTPGPTPAANETAPLPSECSPWSTGTLNFTTILPNLTSGVCPSEILATRQACCLEVCQNDPSSGLCFLYNYSCTKSPLDGSPGEANSPGVTYESVCTGTNTSTTPIPVPTPSPTLPPKETSLHLWAYILIPVVPCLSAIICLCCCRQCNPTCCQVPVKDAEEEDSGEDSDAVDEMNKLNDFVQRNETKSLVGSSRRQRRY